MDEFLREQDQELAALFLQSLALSLSEFVLYVTDYYSQKDHDFIELMNQKSGQKKNIIVVHNLKGVFSAAELDAYRDQHKQLLQLIEWNNSPYYLSASSHQANISHAILASSA